MAGLLQGSGSSAAALQLTCAPASPLVPPCSKTGAYHWGIGARRPPINTNAGRWEADDAAGAVCDTHHKVWVNTACPTSLATVAAAMVMPVAAAARPAHLTKPAAAAHKPPPPKRMPAVQLQPLQSPPPKRAAPRPPPAAPRPPPPRAFKTIQLQVPHQPPPRRPLGQAGGRSLLASGAPPGPPGPMAAAAAGAVGAQPPAPTLSAGGSMFVVSGSGWQAKSRLHMCGQSCFVWYH